MKWIIAIWPLVLASCIIPKKGQDIPQSPEPLVKLSLSSDSMTLGDSVALSWTTENVENCRLMANNDTVSVELNLVSGQVHSPEDTTTYRLECQGPDAAVVASEAMVTVLKPGEVLVSLDSLEKIRKAFPMGEITELACEGLAVCQLEDFDERRDFQLELPESMVVYVSEAASTFSLEKIVVVFYELRFFLKNLSCVSNRGPGSPRFPPKVL
jgi:hypothetical protein